jgi:hypothetical protein
VGQPFHRDVTIREAVFYDPVAFLAAIFFLFVILCLFSIIAYVGWFGGHPVRESPSEIFLGLLLIAGLVVAVLRLRVSRITQALRNGEVVAAEVLRGFAHQYFVILLVQYTVHGERIQKQVWLPNTKRPRALAKERRVILAARLEKPKAVVVRDLYVE